MVARAMNSFDYHHNIRGVLEIEAYNRTIASNKQLSQQIFSMQKHMKETKVVRVQCDNCRDPHQNEECVEVHEEGVKSTGQAPFDPHSNNYNSRWRNQPNSS